MLIILLDLAQCTKDSSSKLSYIWYQHTCDNLYGWVTAAAFFSLFRSGRCRQCQFDLLLLKFFRFEFAAFKFYSIEIVTRKERK